MEGRGGAAEINPLAQRLNTLLLHFALRHPCLLSLQTLPLASQAPQVLLACSQRIHSSRRYLNLCRAGDLQISKISVPGGWFCDVCERPLTLLYSPFFSQLELAPLRQFAIQSACAVCACSRSGLNLPHHTLHLTTKLDDEGTVRGGRIDTSTANSRRQRRNCTKGTQHESGAVAHVVVAGETEVDHFSREMLRWRSLRGRLYLVE